MIDTQTILSLVAFFINAALGILFVGALILFLWGVLNASLKKKDTQQRARAHDLIIRGAISATIMAATWGVATILFQIFDITASLP
jgi:hypothetical protein